jgi:hypothetical protein
MPVSRLFVLGALAISAGSGCASQGPDERTGEDEAELHRSLHGIVLVERVDSAEGTRGSVSAKFMRVAPYERVLTERLVGARPVVPESTECVPLAALEQAEAEAQRTAIWADRLRTEPARLDRIGLETRSAASHDLAVELLDVGDVRLLVHQTPGAADDAPVDFSLAPRAFPDVGDLASGVFYTSPDATQSLPAPARYQLGTSGTDALDAFELELLAPSGPSELRIAGERVEPTGTLSIARDVDVALEWTPPDSATLPDAAALAEHADDLIYVDVRVVGLPSAFRCTFPDRGGATLPADVLQAPGTEPADVILAVHRLAERQASLAITSPATNSQESAEKVGDATVRFDLARVVRLTVR